MSGGWTSCVVALGTNMGDRELHAFQALADIRATEGFRVTALSGLHETIALGENGLDPSAPAYLNQVIVLDSAWSAIKTLEALLAIEQSHGRIRGSLRYQERTLDLDLITYGELVMVSEDLTLPHPRAHQRWFVLAPWIEADPDATLPGFGRVADLVASLPTESA